ncbi:CAP-Gly domain-containing linker protein 1-like, partial [Hippocampus comes]|uniref:CAP-Gly domain-containing linker protein 1-like n=1 Tax=Hippocampus comes TaxID=109280 RepID=UPI00094EA349
MQETLDRLSKKEEQCTTLGTVSESLKSQLNGLERKLASADEKVRQLGEDKSKLEKDISDMMTASGDSSVQLSKMNEDLRQKERCSILNPQKFSKRSCSNHTFNPSNIWTFRT